MAKSRLAAMAFPLLFTAAPACGQGSTVLTPEEAAALDRAMSGRRSGDPACSQSPAEIVVCGRRVGGGGQRMEFPREPGEIVRHINEPGSGLGALAADRCTRLCNVGVSVSLIGAARAAPKIIRHILGRD